VYTKQQNNQFSVKGYMDWISTEELLPVLDTDQLCYVGEHMTVGRLTATGWVDDHGLALFGVTYWQPLPSPPTDLPMTFSFTLFIVDRVVTCTVATGESDYGILFDGELMDIIEMNEDGLWEAQSKTLDGELVQEIGKKIEDHFT
jgi:hypothetical protein